MNSRILYVVFVSFFSHIYGCQSPSPQYLVFLAQQSQDSGQKNTETTEKNASIKKQTFTPIQLPETSASSQSPLPQRQSGSDTPPANPARCP